MEIKWDEVLREACLCLNLQANTKAAAIAEMVDLLVAAGKVQDRQAVLDAVLARERKMSTGMQCGVAFPHGKTRAVERMVTVFAMKPEGLDFAALDGHPCRIFVMTVSPLTQSGPHIEYLAQMGRLLDVPAVRDRLLAASSPDDILRVLLE